MIINTVSGLWMGVGCKALLNVPADRLLIRQHFMVGKRHNNFTITIILEPFAGCVAKEAVAFWSRQQN